MFFISYIGNYRPVKLIRSKIEHILATYKAALEVVNSSGEGLADAEYDSFMNHIHRKYCKWYTALDSVLGCRPNMQAAYTNEDSIDEDSDEEATCDTNIDRQVYVGEPSTTEPSADCSAGPSQDTGNSYSKSIKIVDTSDDNTESESSRNDNPNPNMLDISDLTATTSSNSCSSGNNSKRSNRSTTDKIPTTETLTPQQTPNKKTKVVGKTLSKKKGSKISVLQAAKTHRSKKLTIADKSLNSLKDNTIDSESHLQHMYRMHEDKMRRRDQHHNQTMRIEQRRIEMEEKRMKRDETLAELQAEKLKGEVMKGIMDYNFDVMKKRKEMKEMYPDITDATLDTMLPLRDIPDLD